ncbi:IS110 family transposase [Streptomyces sp. NBC_01320]|uniref:IS110 family transposase n=1 Tax=Streptomyces sp. NBC_01320 TaxID=2903824 RepID=UPI002E0FC999|nr:IS110 family transposase [Streptomyces sp. NBC_01320]WSK02191.1 IS110 family transposase [Streptomyces sp. NBC_01320]
MTEFVGGRSQAEYMARVRDLPQRKCLVVAVDVGKHSAMGLIADHCGQIFGDPVDFALTLPGATALEQAVRSAVHHSDAASVRIGIEAAGHYHRALAAHLRDRGFDVVELNPYQVKLARGQMGQARVKTDLRDCMAMIELLVRGQGWPLRASEEATAEQRAWVAHRRRKLHAAKALCAQIHALADTAVPGLTGCFTTGLESPTLRMLLATLPDPGRIAALDVTALVGHAADHGRRMLRPKASQVITAAREAMCVPEADRAIAARLLTGEMAEYETLLADLGAADRELAGLLQHTPAGVLLSVPGVGPVTASYYGAALGDPHRFSSADAAWRYAGLAPTSYESAGHRGSARINKIGSVELRQAVITLGVCVAQHHPDFAAYKQRLREAGKKPMVASIATAHRVHRLTFALMRSQQPYDAERWTAAVTAGRARNRPVTASAQVTRTT